MWVWLVAGLVLVFLFILSSQSKNNATSTVEFQEFDDGSGLMDEEDELVEDFLLMDLLDEEDEEEDEF